MHSNHINMHKATTLILPSRTIIPIQRTNLNLTTPQRPGSRNRRSHGFPAIMAFPVRQEFDAPAALGLRKARFNFAAGFDIDFTLERIAGVRIQQHHSGCLRLCRLARVNGLIDGLLDAVRDGNEAMALHQHDGMIGFHLGF